MERDDALNGSLKNLKVSVEGEEEACSGQQAIDCLQINCFTEIVDDVTLHFQIIRFPEQIYAWISSNSAKFGHLYAAASTRPSNAVGVACLLGGVSDNTGSGIARRLVLKTGLNILLACNIPKNTPMLEANAERKLIEKLTYLGYTKPKSQGLSAKQRATSKDPAMS